MTSSLLEPPQRKSICMLFEYGEQKLKQKKMKERLHTSDKSCSVLSRQMPALILRCVSRNAMRSQGFFDELAAVIRHHASMLISAVLMIIAPKPRGASLHLPTETCLFWALVFQDKFWSKLSFKLLYRSCYCNARLCQYWAYIRWLVWSLREIC